MEDSENTFKNLPPKHHVQQELCTTRPLYRRGRKLTAVKVYTINNESQHVMVYGVPVLKLSDELKTLCFKYGELKNFELVKDYNVEEFTQCYHVHYKRIQSARIAKRFLDNTHFYGSQLHVCYAPEYETITEVRDKLKQRQKDVQSRIQPGPSLAEYAHFQDTPQQGRKRKHPALPITEKRLKNEDANNVWDGIPSELDPRLQDPFCSLSTVGLKKHFQVPNTTLIGPTCNFLPGDTSVSDSSLELKDSKIQTSNPRLQYPLSNFSTVGSRECFQIPNTARIGPTYKSLSADTSDVDSSSQINDSKMRTTLIPTVVIKSHTKEYNKKIIFRNNNKGKND